MEDGNWDYRLLDFRKTVENIRTGHNPYGFFPREIKEFERLEALLYNKLLPAEYDSLLYIESD